MAAVNICGNTRLGMSSKMIFWDMIIVEGFTASIMIIV